MQNALSWQHLNYSCAAVYLIWPEKTGSAENWSIWKVLPTRFENTNEFFKNCEVH